MKNPILSALVLITLSACASDKGDVNVSKGAVKTTGACMELKGKYIAHTNTEQGPSTSELELDTQVVNGIMSYKFASDADFLVADGQEKAVDRNGEKGVIKITCSAQTVEVESTPEGKAKSTAKYTAPAANELKVEATGDLASLTGTYTKEGSDIAPAPVTPPTPVDPVNPAPAPSVSCPVFNGKYVRKEGDMTIDIFFSTKEEAGVYSYSFDEEKTFFAADGKAKDVQDQNGKGTITVTCDATTVNAVAIQNGQTMTMKYTAVAANQVKVEASGDAAVMNGVFTRE